MRTLPCLKSKERETYFDITKGTPAGFALRVTANGGRSYVLKFYVKGTGARGWLTLGDADERKGPKDGTHRSSES